jgi:hypothetical protein
VDGYLLLHCRGVLDGLLGTRDSEHRADGGLPVAAEQVDRVVVRSVSKLLYIVELFSVVLAIYKNIVKNTKANRE